MGLQFKSFSKLAIYRKKRLWKILLMLFALVIVSVSLWYSNVLVHKIAQDERTKIRTWANAIHHRAELVIPPGILPTDPG